MEISTEWVLGSFLALAGVIGTMAKLIYDSLAAQIGTQNTQINHQNGVISKLQEDVDRLSKGCGHASCTWSDRLILPPKIKE